MISGNERKSVCWAILVRNGADYLPTYLKCLLHQDYDKKLIYLYIRTNDNSDETEEILENFISQYGSLYAGVEYCKKSIKPELSVRGQHEWQMDSLQIMANIRQESLDFANKNNFDFYFASDVDNFLTSKVLTELVKLDLPVVAPYLITAQGDLPRYRNFHERIGSIGEFIQSERNLAIVAGELVGLLQVDLVHCSYLIKANVFEFIDYQYSQDNYEYRNFALSLQKNAPHVKQFLDARKTWGCLTLTDNLEFCEQQIILLETDARSFAAHEIQKELLLAHNSFYEKKVVSSTRFTDRHERFMRENKHITFDFVLDYATHSPEIKKGYPILNEGNSKLRAGSIDRALSHIKLMQDAIESNKNILILEDDVKLHKDFDRLLEKILLNHPEFDIILLGFNWDAYVFGQKSEDSEDIVKLRFNNQSLIDSWEDLEHSFPSPEIMKMLMGWGLCATLTSPKGAIKVLNHLREFQMDFVPAEKLSITYEVTSFDSILNALYPNTKTFVTNPPLAWSKNLKEESKIWAS